MFRDYLDARLVVYSDLDDPRPDRDGAPAGHCLRDARRSWVTRGSCNESSLDPLIHLPQFGDVQGARTRIGIVVTRLVSVPFAIVVAVRV